MKRFFNFLSFMLLLVLAVAMVRVWSNRYGGPFYGWRQWAADILNGTPIHRHPEKYTVAEGPRIDPKDVDVLAAMSRERVVLARAVVPSVVSIISSRNIAGSDWAGDPFAFFHRGVPRGAGRAEKQLGSGAIVTREGHIVTNQHVIEGMDAIQVELSDGRRRQARLVGSDADTDIAVLKIEADNLQPIPLGDSERVEVGETVLAVGNPYGLEESVTQGIISAKNRHGSENTSDLFQTDSAINPGNSGGPLINVRGELIGINEAIFSESGGWQGVGFAIPADTVRRTMDGILRVGRAIHSYLGIQQKPVDPDTAREEGPGVPRGVRVDGIMPGSPAERAQIQPGDVIQKFNDKAIASIDDLKRGVAEVDVDTTVPVELMRDGKVLSVRARIAEGPPPEQGLAQAPHGTPGLEPNTTGMLGTVLHDLTPPDLKRLDLPESTRGVLVMEVRKDSPLADKLQPGDVIEEVNRQPVASVAEIRRHLRLLPANHPVIVSVLRAHQRIEVDLGAG